LTEARNGDWFLDYDAGYLFVRNAFPLYRNKAIRARYEYGGTDCILGVDLGAGETSALIASGVEPFKDDRFEFGPTWLRIADEYIGYQQRNEDGSQFVGLTRGLFDTQATQHDTGAYVIQVPDDVRSAAIKLAAAYFVQNADNTVYIVQGGNIAEDLGSRAKSWKEEAWRSLRKRRQEWKLVD
jgi:hypothetical protein